MKLSKDKILIEKYGKLTMKKEEQQKEETKTKHKLERYLTFFLCKNSVLLLIGVPQLLLVILTIRILMI